MLSRINAGGSRGLDSRTCAGRRPREAPIHSATMPSFRHEGQRLAYEIHGEGNRNVVLLPGLLFGSRMHEPLARELAAVGNRVILFDLLGHGKSDRPKDMWRYSMTIFAAEV